jgi:hypothetical protein
MTTKIKEIRKRSLRRVYLKPYKKIQKEKQQEA